MTPAEAVQAVYNGQPVRCTVDEYPAIRRALQEQAGKWIDQDDHVRSHTALSEVRRLDHVHNFQLFTPASEMRLEPS